MQKTKIGVFLGVFLMIVLSISIFVLAKPDVMPDKAKKPVVIPAHAVEVAPGVFYLGKAMDKGKVVEGYAFIHKKKGYAKPTGCKDDGVCQGWEDASCIDCLNGGEDPEEPDTSSCYGFLAKGAKWKGDAEDYIVNPANIRGLDGGFVTSNLAFDIDKWETAAGVEVDILGTGSSTDEVLEADLITTDGQNEVYFADIDYENAIAIAIIWGYFSGPPFARELVEWDMIFDDVDFDWAECELDGETCKINEQMDFENIATHELGHAVGLDDLYDTKCSEVTMYGYASYGETKKRTLEAGDIAGIRALY